MALPFSGLTLSVSGSPLACTQRGNEVSPPSMSSFR
eukprot:CAMPEP_0198148478 /NCGR_PEP_ID=MMETSP1443-20131203/41515_1 /TAXON_ID=186043 /ORGANISM="Entomoneis sp., Strain CCMP2396" /LENGTH=35 /DNA_ID= /DNA_START= /DNA_END= /DNA_ORIENTATION=